MVTRIQLRRDSAANWTSSNPTLSAVATAGKAGNGGDGYIALVIYQ